jgi:glycosyltransferase involved in cell wall biosynthesis
MESISSTSHTTKISVIIPVYNEGSIIHSVVEDVLRKFSRVICVDDGSNDNSVSEIEKTDAELVKHPINLGQGAALQTGIEYALKDKNAKYFVTFDADGQHKLEDVIKMLDYIQTHDVDVVLGSRFLGKAENIGLLKKIVLKAAVKFSNLTTGVHLTDAHNGLRVFNRHFAENVNITLPDMAHASEIIHEIKEKEFKYKELPVTIRYTDYTKSKGQSIMNAINITFDLLMRRISKK